MEISNNNFFDNLQNLQRDADFWNKVGAEFSSNRALQIDEKGIFFNPGWFGAKKENSLTEINAFYTHTIGMLQSTQNDVDNLNASISYLKDQKGYNSAYQALVNLENSIKNSINSLTNFNIKLFHSSPMEKELSNLQQERLKDQMGRQLNQILPMIKELKETISFEQVGGEEEFEIVSSKEELDALHPYYEWETFKDPLFQTQIINTEELKNDLRQMILKAKRNLVPIKDGSKFLVPANFVKDIRRNSALKINGVGYEMIPFNVRKNISNEEEIYQEMIESLGRTGAERLAHFLYQSLAATLEEEAMKALPEKYPTAKSGLYFYVKTNEYNVEIVLRTIFIGQLPEDTEDCVIAQKTIIIPISDLYAADFYTNPLPNVHVKDEISRVLQKNEEWTTKLFLAPWNSEIFFQIVYDENQKKDLLVAVKEFMSDLKPIENDENYAEFLAPSIFIGDVCRFGSLKINNEEIIKEENPFDTPNVNAKGVKKKGEIFMKIVAFLGKEGAARVGAFLNQGIVASLLGNCISRGEKQNLGVNGKGAPSIEIITTKPELKLVIKQLIRMSDQVKGEPVEKSYFVGLREIFIPWNELSDPRFMEKLESGENPIPGLQVIDSFSNSIDYNGSKEEQNEILSLFKNFS